MNDKLDIFLGNIEKKMTKKNVLKKRKSAEGFLESDIQISCVKWFDDYFKLLYPVDAILYSVPNGFFTTNKRYAAKMKAEGLRRGVFDLAIDVPRNGYYGIKIEMKSESGTMSQHQKDMKKYYERNNFYAVVCSSLNEFKKEILRYFKDDVEKINGSN